MTEDWTEEAKAALERAREEARNAGSEWIGTEHLLLGIFGTPSAAAARMKEGGLTEKALRAEIRNLETPAVPCGVARGPFLSNRARNALRFARRWKERMGHAAVTPEALLFGLLDEPEGIACQVLSNLAARDSLNERLLLALGHNMVWKKEEVVGGEEPMDKIQATYRVEAAEIDRAAAETGVREFLVVRLAQKDWPGRTRPAPMGALPKNHLEIAVTDPALWGEFLPGAEFGLTLVPKRLL